MLRDEPYLEYYSRVRINDEVYDAENGVILSIDRVLSPPPPAAELLTLMPSLFSTTIAAIYRVGDMDLIEKLRHSTLFIPSNLAWQKLGYKKLLYLFSNDGKKDLENILKVSAINQFENFRNICLRKVPYLPRKLGVFFRNDQR